MLFDDLEEDKSLKWAWNILMFTVFASIILLLVVIFIRHSPIHFIYIHSNVDEATWSQVGFSFSQIVAALFTPLLVSARLNEFMAFKKSGELLRLQQEITEIIDLLTFYGYSITDEVSKAVLKEYSSLAQRARKIEGSVDLIVPACRSAISLGFILNIYLMCSNYSEVLGPFAIWPIIIMPLTYWLAKQRFATLQKRRIKLDEEFHTKDKDYRKHLLGKVPQLSTLFPHAKKSRK